MKSVKFLLFVFLFAIALGTNAQNTVSGIVQNSDGDPIPYATIAIKNTQTGTITDFDGNFQLTPTEFPTTLVVSFVGYKTQEIKILATDSLTIMMTEGIGLDEVMITGTRVIRSQKQSAMSMTSMKGKEIQTKAASGQADILRSVPGITAEGGGGEVAANVFVRGLPSGGQYVFNPLQYDGMPVISTFGLNSSAHDVYVRNDLGLKALDFPRGGAAILYGAGSVAGLINYISKTGEDKPENIVQLEVATAGRYKADFYSGGKLGGETSKTYYALSGYYRYDDGPIKTGLPSKGYQLRGNIKQKIKDGELVFSGQWIDDRVQFFLPLPLDGTSRLYATGNDGNLVNTIQTKYAKDLSYQTPNGLYETPIEDGVMTKGGYFMANYKQKFANDIKVDGKLRYARYAHEFNLFLAGSGNPASLSNFVASKDADASNISAVKNGTGEAIANSDLVLVNTLLDRNRPMNDMAAEFNATKKIRNEKLEHNITLGAFLSRTEATDENVQTLYVSEFTSMPQLLDINYTADGQQKVLSQNGIYDPGAAYSNSIIIANKAAVYLTNEMRMDRWRIDVGVRVENITAEVTREGSTVATMSNDPSLSTALSTVKTGNGVNLTGTGSDTDWAGVIAANYELNEEVNLYGNVTKGYFFPQPRGIKISADGTVGTYETEQIYQSELGVKYGTDRLTATFAGYYVDLNDRRDVNLIDDPNTPGTIIERVTTQSTRTFGVEATWKYELMKYLNLNGSLTYQNHAYNEHDTNPEYVGHKLARQPDLLGYLSLDYADTKWDGSVSTNYTGQKYTDDSNNVSLDPISIVRLDGGYTMVLNKEKQQTVRLGVSVFNLLDAKGLTEGNPRDLSQSNEGVYFVGRPILPRRVFLRATFNF